MRGFSLPCVPPLCPPLWEGGRDRPLLMGENFRNLGGFPPCVPPSGRGGGIGLLLMRGGGIGLY